MRTIALALAFAFAMPALAANEPAKSDAKSTPLTKNDAAKGAPLTKGEVAKADENRKKPLQRCDELKDKAQLDCLQKARERVVQERAKREAKGEKK